MIEGQKDSEAGEVDKKGDRYRNEAVQEKIQQKSETDVTLTNCRE